MSLVVNVTIEESVGTNTSLVDVGTFNPLVHTQIGLPDESVLTSVKKPICLDSVDTGGVSSLRIDHKAACLVPLGFMGDVFPGRHLGLTVLEEFFLEVSFLVPQGVFSFSLDDEFDSVDWTDEEDAEAETEVWDCWVLNGQEFFPSVYSGFDFNSYAVMDGKAYGTSKAGIYSIGSDHEEEFQAGIILPPTSLGMTQNKRFRVGYVGFSGGQPAVKVQVDGGEARVFRVVRNRFPLQRDLVGRKWQFALADFDTLEFVELFPIILHRSRKA